MTKVIFGRFLLRRRGEENLAKAGRDQKFGRDNQASVTDNALPDPHGRRLPPPFFREHYAADEARHRTARRMATLLRQSRRFPGDAFTAPHEIVLRDVGGHRPFVTHWHNLEDDGYYYGHYFADLVEAARDFEERVARSELRIA